jgi:UDP-N-acetyl-2-amino-2-deoxyglucuronate dehydrogenase
MSDIGIGIIGQGIGYKRTPRALATEGMRLVAVCDLLEDRRDRAAAEFGVPVYEDYRKMLEQPDIDIVAIYTPAGNRREIALDAFDAGKHVYTTKPMEINIQRCDDMIHAADKAGLRLMVDFGMRYSVTNRALKKAAEEGMFGQLIMSKAELRWFRDQAYYDHNGGWRGTWRLDGGGSLANQTIHYIDQAQWIMGEPESVSAQVGIYKHEIQAEDQGAAVIRWKNGAIGTITGSTTSIPSAEATNLEILGERGFVTMGSASGAYSEGEKIVTKASAAWFMMDANGESRQVEPIEVEPGPIDIMADAVAVLRDGAEPMTTGREGRKSVEILNGIYEAAQTDSVVKFPLEKPFIPIDGYER